MQIEKQPMNDYNDLLQDLDKHAWVGWRRPAEAIRKLLARVAELETSAQEPVAWMSDSPTKGNGKQLHFTRAEAWHWSSNITPLYAAPPSPVKPLTAREVELIDGMIEVWLHHAERCDGIANRVVAEKQKEWDLERVALLHKLKTKFLT